MGNRCNASWYAIKKVPWVMVSGVVGQSKRLRLEVCYLAIHIQRSGMSLRFKTLCHTGSRSRSPTSIRIADRLESAGWGGCLRRQTSLGETRQFTRPASPAPGDVTLCARGGLEAFTQRTQICLG